MLNWIKMSEQVPPFDTMVIVRDRQTHTNNVWRGGILHQEEWTGPVRYELAFNQCYRPHNCMTLINREESSHVPFEIYEWALVE